MTDDRIDRYARGELTPAEARDLAQASLDSPELFEELTWSAVAKTALPAVTPSKVVRFPRRYWFIATAAAAALLISFYTVRPFLSTWRSTEVSQAKPALLFLAHPGQPLLLASDIDMARAGELFRSAGAESRAPRQAGSIVQVEEGMATINLGSLDNLAKGSELQIFTDQQSTQPIGRMVVTTVFRERARGRISGGQKIPIHSEVRVAGTVYLGALLEQVDALRDRDLAGARIKAEEAERWAQTADVPQLDRGKALEKLAVLEYLEGSVQAVQSAEKHFRSAADSLDTAPPEERFAPWNNLAVIRLSNGDYSGAEIALNQAISKLPKTGITYARSLNNLGVLAEVYGDPRKAESLYTDALRAFADTANAPAWERQAVETNLKRVKGLH